MSNSMSIKWWWKMNAFFAKKEFWNSLKTSFEMGIEKHDYFQLFWYSPVASW